MTSKNIDAYIEKARSFAQPILKHLRQLIHTACPAVEETIKWGFPHFCYKGIFCSMAAFQNHCAFTFWKGSLLQDSHQILDKTRDKAMGQLGRISHLQDLPSDKIILAYLQEALQLNEKGTSLPKKSSKKTPLTLPEDFMAAVKKNKAALKTFDSFSPSQKREYLEWITEAKQKSTRTKRLTLALEWLSQGKTRNWKYE